MHARAWVGLPHPAVKISQTAPTPPCSQGCIVAHREYRSRARPLAEPATDDQAPLLATHCRNHGQRKLQPASHPSCALVHAAALCEPRRSTRRVRADRLSGCEPRGPEPVHPRLVDMAARAVPRAVTARDGQRHRSRLPDRVLDVIHL